MTWVATLAVAALACGRGGSSARAPNMAQGDTGNTGNVQTGTGSTGTQGGVPCDGSVTLMVRGVDPGALDTFKLDVASIELKAGGAALTPDRSAAGTTLSLPGTEASVLAAVRRVAGPVDVTVRFDHLLACQAAGCFEVDACTAPITFQYDVDRVVPDGCHVFLQLDLAGSVQPISGGQTFLPRFSVKYW